MMQYICIHPPKVFIQSWLKFTQLGKSKTRGNVNQEIGIQNIIQRENKENHRNIYNKGYRRYIHRWWYINRRIRPPTKILPIIPITHTPCNIINKKKQIKPCNIICKIQQTKINNPKGSENSNKQTNQVKGHRMNNQKPVVYAMCTYYIILYCECMLTNVCKLQVQVHIYTISTI